MGYPAPDHAVGALTWRQLISSLPLRKAFSGNSGG